MYIRILKKDLNRKRTMNLILLVFIILAATFVSSSANNLITVSKALDSYFDMAGVPDYWHATSYKEEAERFERFADENGYDFKTTELLRADPNLITVSGEPFEYQRTVCVSTVNGTRAFDKNGEEITSVQDGDIYVTSEIFHSDKNDFYTGCRITLEIGGNKKEFTLKSYTKDAFFGSSMIDMTRFLISENDFAFFNGESAFKIFSLHVYTDDEEYNEKFDGLDLKTTINTTRSGMKMMYIMDILISAVILVVSICLILISMVILRFTINFTMSEEFREIGVMKAIGISNGGIRRLYIIKYFAVSAVGAAIGFGLSIPFGNLMIESVSRNMIIPGGNRLYLNAAFALLTAAAVVLFCYFCTRKIKKFSPIDAIRNGETGERYKRKGILRLNRLKLAPVPFMALNDILSGLKKYVSMILIFTLGLLLIIIPVNTINTLQSDKVIKLFNMADCDIVISAETLFNASEDNEEKIRENLEGIKKTLKDNGIDADVFQEILFRFNVSKDGRKSSALSIQGTGGVKTDMYSYIKGTPPRNENEVALSHITAERINAEIGDEVEIAVGEEVRKYIVTAINQTMTNLGEGIRFYEGDRIDYGLAMGCFGAQIRYNDNPDGKTLNERKELLQRVYSENEVYTAGEYVSYMIGGVADQLRQVKSLILGIIVCINILVAVLMVKSFITKEKGEIAVLKAIGFKNSSLVLWQSMRIGIVLLISIILGTVLSEPLSKLVCEPIFKIMGAYSIEFDIMPLEVYVIYPLAVFFSTLLAAAAGALQLRKISASETADAE